MFNGDDTYMYIVDLGHGEIKIGITSSPETRLQAYGYSEFSSQKPFISKASAWGDIRECERIVCYRLREYLYRGREFFKCELGHAINITETVLAEMEGSVLEDLSGIETENIHFRGLDVGTKRIIIEAAEREGHDTIRQLFVAWVEKLKVK